MVDFFGFVILGIFAISFIVLLFNSNFAKDYTNVINNKYETVIGRVIDQGPKNETGLRNIYVENSAGQSIKYKVRWLTYELGNTYKIIYLPNTGFGSIIRQIE